MDSILTSVKKMLGIDKQYKHFDSDIIMHINSVFTDLAQIGVGPTNSFAIEDDLSEWVDFLPDNVNLQAVKSYMFLRVKLLFDPPSSATVVNAMQREIDKWEWRLNVWADTGAVEDEPSEGDTTKLDYNMLDNLPSINGTTLKGNYDEKDPTIDVITEDDIEKLWDE